MIDVAEEGRIRCVHVIDRIENVNEHLNTMSSTPVALFNRGDLVSCEVDGILTINVRADE